MTPQVRRDFLGTAMKEELVTLYVGLPKQHLGDTPADVYALALLQGFVWGDRTKESQSSQVKKFKRFLLAECRRTRLIWSALLDG